MPTAAPNLTVTIWSKRQITRFGLKAEPNQPIFVHEVNCRATCEKEIGPRGALGDIIGIAFGNQSCAWDVEVEELARYGVSDTWPGTRLTPAVLANLDAPEFGMGAGAPYGLMIFRGGSRLRNRGALPIVRFTVEMDNVTSSAGSPDGPSTPSIITGGAGGTKPAFTLSAPIVFTLGVPAAFELTMTGTPPLAIFLKEGYTLPPGLSLSGGVITGMPTGAESRGFFGFRASNNFGTAETFPEIIVGEPVIGPIAPVTAYVRTLRTVIAGGAQSWETEDYTLSPEPTTLAAFLAATGLTLAVTTVGGSTYEIVEILGFVASGGVRSAVYWHRETLTPRHHCLLSAWSSAQNPLTICDGPVPEDEEPDPPTPPDTVWPGTRKPAPAHISQYFLLLNTTTNERFVAMHGTPFTHASLGAYLAANPTVDLVWLDTSVRVLIEAWNAGSYWHQLTPADTLIDDLFDANKSPYWYGGTPAGRVGNNHYTPGRTAPAFTVVDLPTPSGLFTGPAPSPGILVFVLLRSYMHGRYGVRGFRASGAAAYDTLQEYLTANPNVDCEFDEVSSDWRIEEQWVKEAGVWKGRWLQTGVTPATSKIGRLLADGVSPINHTLTGPGDSLVIGL